MSTIDGSDGVHYNPLETTAGEVKRLEKNEDGTYKLDPAESVERAFQMLEIHGVARARAKDVANGIDVLMTRIHKEDQIRAAQITELTERDRQWREKVEGLVEELNLEREEMRLAALADSGGSHAEYYRAADHYLYSFAAHLNKLLEDK